MLTENLKKIFEKENNKKALRVLNSKFWKLKNIENNKISIFKKIICNIFIVTQYW